MIGAGISMPKQYLHFVSGRSKEECKVWAADSVMARQTPTALVPLLRSRYSSSDGKLLLNWYACSMLVMLMKQTISSEKSSICAAL